MPNRSFSSSDYRYGFNGQEKDDEVKGSVGIHYDFKFRMYDPRLGRFFSIDPLTAQYPMHSPYQFAANNPIRYFDLEGLEPAERNYTLKERKALFGHIDNVFVYSNPKWTGVNTAGSVFYIHKNDQGEFIREQIIEGDPSKPVFTVIKGGPNAGWAINKTTPTKVEVEFNSNSNALSKASLSELTKAASVLQENAGQIIKIKGQSDASGVLGDTTIDGVTKKGVTAKELADARAANIQSTLIGMGVDPSQIEMVNSEVGAGSRTTSATIQKQNKSNLPKGEIKDAK
jgi:RHS repeat-associated protein